MPAAARKRSIADSMVTATLFAPAVRSPAHGCERALAAARTARRARRECPAGSGGAGQRGAAATRDGARRRRGGVRARRVLRRRLVLRSVGEAGAPAVR